MHDWTGHSIGRYHIIEKLGEGGMAYVYRAFDTHLERHVAIKIIRTDEFAPVILQEVLQRFEREVRSLAKLTHPNIIAVIDFGEEEQTPYLVMPLVSGGTLKQITGKAIPYDQAVNILLPIAQALDYAHSQGIIHRDIKPSNILLTETGNPLLTDFGIAKLLDIGEGKTLTGSGVGIGTPEYMAPEQGLGNPVDERVDIYALGVVFYELITGRKPFIADTPMAVVLKQVSDPLPRPTLYVPEIPQEAEQVLFKALAKNPADRYRNMREFAYALSHIERNADNDETASRKDLLAAGRTISKHPNAKTDDKKRPGWLWPAIGAGCLLFVVGGGLFVTNRNGYQPAASVRATQAQQAAITIALNTETAVSDLLSATATTQFTATSTLPPPTATFNPSPTPTARISTSTPAPKILQLTMNSGINIQPFFSPDGKKIIFTSYRDGNAEIYIMDSDGSNQKRLTNSPKLAEDLPGFSPDGTKIIFAASDSMNQDLYLMNVDGTNVINITNTADMREARPRLISETPLTVLFDAAPLKSETWNIYSGVILDNQLTRTIKLTMNPDYRYRLASFIPAINMFVSRREVISQGGASSRLILHNLSNGEEKDISGGHLTIYPQVSPDGKWVFFASSTGKMSELYRVSTVDWSIVQVPVEYLEINSLAISPDTQWLIICARRDNIYDLFRIPFPK